MRTPVSKFQIFVYKIKVAQLWVATSVNLPLPIQLCPQVVWGYVT